MAEERLFTLEEATALLPRITPLLETLREAHRAVGEGRERLAALVRLDGGGASGREMLEAGHTAGRCIAELEALGVTVRDPETGLVDFLSQREGERVWLCWRLGEERIAWWHPLDTGFAGRRPL